ncbi:MAG: MFS transporter [Gammaproteobacteria bacterium]|nr:MFS transporter [Gammaproteobacteria bacterium]
MKNHRILLAWCLFDWASSAFPVVIITFIFGTYFTSHIATNSIIGTYQWANAMAIAGVLVAIGSPILGAIADNGGGHKSWLILFTLLCVVSSFCLWFSYPDVQYVKSTLLFVILGTIGLELSVVFYNAYLPHIAPPTYLGRISGWAWGLGYVGGIFALSIVLFGFVKSAPAWLNSETGANVRICGPLCGLWFLIFALPFFWLAPEIDTKKLPIKDSIRQGLKDLANTLKKLPQQKSISFFLIAHMIFIDGLNTLFTFAGIFAAATFGMDLTHVILFGISMNVSAGLGAILLAWVDDYFGSKPTILFSLLCMFFLGLPIIFIHNSTLFWGMALVLSLFVGPVQAASRSLMARLTPSQQSTEMFGLYAFSGKITAFVGPWLFGVSTLYFHSQRAGIASILLFFMIGGSLMAFVKEPPNDRKLAKQPNFH